MTPAGHDDDGQAAARQARLDSYEDCREVRLGDLPHAAAHARRFVSEALASWQVSVDCIDTVALLTTEIVTNAVRHAPPPLELVLRHGEPGIRVDVADSRSDLVLRPRPDLDSEGGRGLWLVEILADRWGHHSRPLGDTVGKVVWFELRDPPERHPASP